MPLESWSQLLPNTLWAQLSQGCSHSELEGYGEREESSGRFGVLDGVGVQDPWTQPETANLMASNLCTPAPQPCPAPHPKSFTNLPPPL